MNRRNVIATLLFVIASLVIACGPPRVTYVQQAPPVIQQPASQPTVQAATPDIASQLDLNAVGAIANSCHNATEFEQQLNAPNGVNNLHLDNSGTVNFISVTGYKTPTGGRGFSLTALTQYGDQEVANIVYQAQPGNTVLVQVVGSPVLYPQGVCYTSYMPIYSVPLYSWAYISPLYVPLWGFGRYPSYYHSYSPMTVNNYQTYTRRVTKTTVFKQVQKPPVTFQSPNQGKVVQKFNQPSPSNPTQSQKPFEVRSPTKQYGGGGFGNGANPQVPATRPNLKVNPTAGNQPSVTNPTQSQKPFEVRSPTKQYGSGGFGNKPPAATAPPPKQSAPPAARPNTNPGFGRRR